MGRGDVKAKGRSAQAVVPTRKRAPTYRDLSHVRPPHGFKPVARIEEMTFAQRVHHMLSQQEFNGLVTWMPHGRAFKVLVIPLFEIHVCEKYFGHRSYGKFREDLNKNGFKYISDGRDEGGKLPYG